jgi:acyl-phosphate glycerol 3-phosphate acyltransferase
MRFLISLVTGYLIGSIPWSFIFAKIFSGKDIRKEGTKNVGTTNAWKIAGPVAGVLSFTGDSTKGVLAILIGFLLGIGKSWWPLLALVAIIGHSWSIWLKGKGGVGVAAAVGSFVVLFPLESAAFGILAGTLWLTFGKGIMFVLSFLWPFVILIGYLRGTMGLLGSVLTIILVAWLFIKGWENLKSAFQEVKEPLKDSFVRRKIWRYMGLLFPGLAYPLWGPVAFRYIVVIAGLIALSLELIRKYSKSINEFLKKIFKPTGKSEEAHKISGTSYFLMGSAIAGLFSVPYSLISIVMLAMGDSWAVLVGKKWGKHQWLKGKSVEGSLACFFISFVSGVVYMNLIGLPISYMSLIVGALSATVVEGFGNLLNDNLTMAPIAAFFMWLVNI